MLTRLTSALKSVYGLVSLEKGFPLEVLSSERIAVAVSGGADSIFLSIALHKLKRNILALVVDHQIQAGSGTIANNTKIQLNGFGIDAKILTWEHDNISSGIETKAREARYRLIIEECKKCGIRQLFVAHHLGDQVETFLMNLARGSGIDGLTGIKPVVEVNDILIIRPMLEIPKEDILYFLKNNNINWHEDVTNQDTSFHRNAIRKALKTAQDSHLMESRINSAIQRLTDVKSIVDKSVKETLSRVVVWHGESMAEIKMSDYKNLLFAERTYIVSDVLMKISNIKKKGRFNSLRRLIQNIENDSKGKQTLMHSVIEWSQTEIIFYKEKPS